MSYSFRDTTASAVSNNGRPTEAMSFGGLYLEDQITGYKTLSVSGRESIPVEISELTNSITNGSRYLRKRYAGRTITVQYQLIASSAASFRAAYNKLSKILDSEQAQVIFADEPDKYFIGTCSGLGSVDPGTNAVVGEFTIRCADPFKYSVTEYTAQALNGVIFADYGGTYTASPVFEAVHDAENGCLVYIDDAGHVIQLGDPEEIDGVSYTASTVVVNDTFPTGNLSSQWTTGGTSSSTIRCGEYGAYASAYGSASSWHGPTMSKAVSGTAENFTLAWRSRFYATDKTQTGRFKASVQASSTELAAIEIYKNGTKDMKAKAKCYLNGTCVKTWEFTVGRTDKIVGISAGGCRIEKFGQKLTFQVGPKVFSVTDESIAETSITSAKLGFYKYGTNTVINTNTVRKASLSVHNVDAWREVKNKFQAGDVVVADCRSGEVTVNGMIQYGLGALGNDWEEMKLTPGENNITPLCSDWVTEGNRPTITMKYREVFL